MARNFTDAADGFLLRKRFLIMDRDARVAREFRQLLTNFGVGCLRPPVRSPNLNLFDESLSDRVCRQRRQQSALRTALQAHSVDCGVTTTAKQHDSLKVLLTVTNAVLPL